MPPRRLVWSFEATQDLVELLKRRKHQADVHACIEGHAQSVADDVAIASTEPGPAHFRVHRFRCLDGDVGVYVRLIFDAESDAELVVLAVRPLVL